MSDFTLIIGNKNYSSWSLRPWLALKQAGVPFREHVVPLGQPNTAAEIEKHSPSRKVPALKHGALTIWESLAILEYLAEQCPAAGLWPADAEARAVARAVSAEMHAGFVALRANLPMNIRKSLPPRDRGGAEVTRDIERITAIWRDCRARFGQSGPFLFGRFGNADAMYAPVVMRFASYGIRPDAASQAYMDAVLALPTMREWSAAARAEPWTIAHAEVE